MKDEKGRLPSFQFYPADWRSDPGVQSLSFHERGIWFEMLCLMHESEDRGKLLLNGKPMPVDALARALGLLKQDLEIVIKKLLDYGVVGQKSKNSVLFSRRMVRDESLRIMRKKCGEMGGNPNLVNQKSTTRVKQKSTPSSASAVASAVTDLRPNTLVASAEATSEKIPFEELRTAYNDRRGALPKAGPFSEPAKKKIRVRWHEHPDMSFWNSLFEKVGKSERMVAWADFHWLMKSPLNIEKTVNGNYDNDREKKTVPRVAPVVKPREIDPVLSPEEIEENARDAAKIFGEFKRRRKVGTFTGPPAVASTDEVTV